MGRPIKDMRGLRFGKLTVLNHAGFTPGRNATWECRCDCGNITVVANGNLKKKFNSSCGCSAHPEKHGRSNDYIFRLWHHARDRCCNPKSQYFGIYGGRGITFWPAWEDASRFISDVISEIGERPAGFHSLDRIDNNRGYEPGNIRWATWKEQANNKRNNRHLVCNGVRRTIAEWSAIKKIDQGTIRMRLNRGCTPKEALRKIKKKSQIG